MNVSQLTQSLVLGWIRGPFSDQTGLTEQLGKGMDFILPWGEIRVVKRTQNSHPSQLQNKNYYNNQS